MRKQPAGNGVTCFVICNALPFERSNDRTLLLYASYDAVNGIQEVLGLDLGLASACCCEGCLVADIGNIGTAEARSMLCHKVHLEIRCDLEALDMNLEDFGTLLKFRQVNVYLTVESSRTHKRLVENIGAVGCGEDYHTAVGAETIHLGKKLVQSIFSFVI